MKEKEDVLPVYYRKGPVTICLLASDPGKVVARGVSICSDMDFFEENTGRMKAYGRAMQAKCHKKDVSPVRCLVSGKFIPDHVSEYAKKDLNVQFNTDYKGFYKPDLTEEEKVLVSFK